MNDIQKVERFNYFEKLFFKITLGILGSAIFLFIFTMATVSQFPVFSKVLINVTVVILFLSAINLILAIGRILKFAIKISKFENNIGILRTASSLLLSPLAFVILYILIIVMALASCTV